MDIITSIRQFMATELRIAEVERLDPEFPLVRRGAVDSIELIQVVMFLERAFGITVDETEVLPSNVGTLAAMERFVTRKLSATIRSV
jgi:acyl carrier protein